MKIKSLEMFGFKAFADKTVFHFEDGITGIVGPNGAGKSNCVDALRWVMGEQSAKNLRGGEMQDVIFNGTSTRAPLGMAQVILTFDTSDGRAPAGYQDYSEIAVERRLYRSGESEYYINKVPCRLRDIVDLFLGTGVGTKAYSIIEQGKIGHIVSSKPESRRLVIEEAAGISKFKNRKEAALRRMESTVQNLERLTDVVAEIKRQLNSLDRQAKKAERYKKLFDELKTRDLRLSFVRYHSLEMEVLGLEKTLNIVCEQETLMSGQLSTTESKTDEGRLRQAELGQQLNHVQENFYLKQNEAKLHEAQIEFQRKKIEDLKHQSENYTKEISDLRERLQGCEAEVERLGEIQTGAGLVLNRAQQQIDQINEVYQTAAKRCDELKGKVEAANKEMLQLVSLVAESQSRLEYLERREVELKGRVAKGQAEVDGIDKLMKELSRKINSGDKDLEELSQLKLHLHDATTQAKDDLKTKREELELAQYFLDEAKTHVAHQESRLSSTEAVRKNLEGYQEGVRHILKVRENLPGICGAVSDLVDTEEVYEPAVHAALGEKLQYVVVESQAEGVAALDYLKTQTSGRSTFVPLNLQSEETLPALHGEGVLGPLVEKVRLKGDFKKIGHYLFGDCMLVEDLNKALNLWSSGNIHHTLVTLQGDVIDRSGALSGGVSGDGGLNQQSLLNYERHLEEQKTKTAVARARLAEAQNEWDRLKKIVRGCEEYLETSHRDTHGGEIRRVQQERDNHRFRDEMGRLSKDRDRLSIEIVQALEENTEVNQEIERMVLKLNEYLIRKENIESSFSVLQVELTVASDEKEKTAHDATKMKALGEQATERAVAVARDLERVLLSRKDFREGIEKRKSQISACQAEMVQLMAAQSEGRHALEEGLKEVEQLGAAQQKFREEYASISLQVKERESQLKLVRKEHEALVKTWHAAELQLAEKRNGLVHLVDQAMERYQVNIRKQSMIVSDEEAFDLQQEELAVVALRETVEKIGSVHVGAIEEYEELNRRYEFLTHQKEDLEKSLADLKKAIQKINKVSRERFLRTFELVNAKFQELFPRLFKGGKGKLILLDEANPLESGVEIVVQPPGKKLQVMTLLSGGEKALTAVALVFSIFLIKPSPFCLLDEVDAPLDDANIDRFNDIVHEMTGQSQFIIITHNKRTMERTDALYGVTMEDPGCSKIVSVKLNVEKKAAVAEVA